MDLTDFFIGIVVGVATNIFSWWILFHGIVPKVRFSPYISKTPFTQTGHDISSYRYRVKYENAGGRAIIDLEVMARLSIKGLGPYETSWHMFLVPLNPDGELSFRTPRLLPKRKNLSTGHINRFHINSAVEHLDRPPYPDNIREKARLGTLQLEDLLNLGSEAFLEVQAFGYDEFSGARKLFISKPYTARDIREGPFEKHGLNIKVSSQEQNDQVETGEAVKPQTAG